MAPNNLPTQEQLDNCKTYQDKLKLLQPEKYQDLNERELSSLFSKITKPYLCYNTSIKKWMYYNGKYWEADLSGVYARSIVKKFSYEMMVYASNHSTSEDDPIFKLAHRLSFATDRKSLLGDSIDNNTIQSEDLDSDIYLLNLQNGTYDLQLMQLRPHSYKDYISRLANVSYEPTAQSSALDSFISSIFSNNQDLIDYVYKVLGYSLTGDTSQECFWLLLGETTRNGKSTLLYTFAHMLGGPNGYATNCDISSLAKKKVYNGSSPSSDIARLKGARFVIASEPPADFQLDEAKIKALTGGDRITARMLRSNDIEFTPTFKIFIGTNHRPPITDDSILNSNRIKIIPFLKHFSENEQIKNLKESLKDPMILSALLNKCLEGLERFRNEGFKEPTIVNDSIAKYQTSGQVLDLFFNTNMNVDPINLLPLVDFYPVYQEWCNDNGFIPIAKPKVNEYLRTKGIYKASGTIDGKTIRNVIWGYSFKENDSINTNFATVLTNGSLSPDKDFIPNELHEESKKDPQTNMFDDLLSRCTPLHAPF